MLTLHFSINSLINNDAHKCYSSLVLTTIEYMHLENLHYGSIDTKDTENARALIHMTTFFSKTLTSRKRLPTPRHMHLLSNLLANNDAQKCYSS